MTRCARRVSLALLLTVTAWPSIVAAQVQRAFPANALRAEIVFGLPPQAEIEGRAVRLAPGARIRGANNLLQMSGALAGQRALVHYTVDDYGLLRDIWILTDEERAREPWPRTPEQAAAWRFDPAAQAWSRP